MGYIYKKGAGSFLYLLIILFCVQLVRIFFGMRRSAAPSQKGPAPKKAFFIPPFLSTKKDSDATSVSVQYQ